MQTAVTLETILKILGVATPVGAFLGWWLGNLLTAKKDMVVLQTKFNSLCEKVESLEEEVDRNRRDFEHYKERNQR